MKILNPDNLLNTFIVTYINTLWLEDCINSLVATTDMSFHRLIAINPPMKEMGLLHTKIAPDINIYTQKNYGWSQCMNLGIANVRTPYFTLIHDDLKFLEYGWWHKCREEFDRNNKLMLVQPQEVPQKFESKSNTDITNIYCMVFRTDLFKQHLQLLDERWYPVGPEDVDLLFRIENAGYKTMLTKAASVWHKGSGRKFDLSHRKWDDKEYIWMKDKYGVETYSKYDKVYPQLEEDVLKQI